MIPVTSTAVSLLGGSLNPVNEASSTLATGHMESVTQGLGATMSAGAPGATSAPFADLLTEAVGQVQQLEQQSKVAIEGLMSGRGVDVHEAMIATQKAGMGFELVLSVRNKALAAYQQVLGMQF